jgi:hypothetical protein
MLGPDDPERPGRVLQLIYHAHEDVDAFGDGLLVDGRVAEDEAAGAGVADPVGRHALSEARKIVRQACHILTELGDDALTAA